jgi:PKD repeat protein
MVHGLSGLLYGFALTAAAALLIVVAARGSSANAALSTDITSWSAPLRVVFSNLSEGSDRFTWDFGDDTIQADG